MEALPILWASTFASTVKSCASCFRCPGREEAIVMLLERFLEGSDGEVSVQVGLGEAHPGMKELP